MSLIDPLVPGSRILAGETFSPSALKKTVVSATSLPLDAMTAQLAPVSSSHFLVLCGCSLVSYDVIRSTVLWKRELQAPRDLRDLGGDKAILTLEGQKKLCLIDSRSGGILKEVSIPNFRALTPILVNDHLIVLVMEDLTLEAYDHSLQRQWVFKDHPKEAKLLDLNIADKGVALLFDKQFLWVDPTGKVDWSQKLDASQHHAPVSMVALDSSRYLIRFNHAHVKDRIFNVSDRSCVLIDLPEPIYKLASVFCSAVGAKEMLYSTYPENQGFGHFTHRLVCINERNERAEVLWQASDSLEPRHVVRDRRGNWIVSFSLSGEQYRSLASYSTVYSHVRIFDSQGKEIGNIEIPAPLLSPLVLGPQDKACTYSKGQLYQIQVG